MKKIISLVIVLSIFISAFSVVPSVATEKTSQKFPQWTKIEGLGDLSSAEIKRSTAANGNLSGEKITITNMAYGTSNMRSFTIMNDGIAENGNDFSKYPQKVEIVTVDGAKALHIDSPAAGNAVAMFMPLVIFDDTYTNKLSYKYSFKAKRGTGEVFGDEKFNFYVRQLDEKGARNGGQTSATLIEKSDGWVEYSVVVKKDEILDTTARLTGLFNAGSSECFKDIYIKDIAVYVTDNESLSGSPQTISLDTSKLYDWTKVEGLGSLKGAKVNKSSAESGSLKGNKVTITNMAYGMNNMRSFTIMNEGIAENGNDFSKYPQKVEIVTVDGEEALYIDSPAAGNSLVIYLPVIAFDDVLTKELNYKFRFKAKRGNEEVLGNDSISFYVRQQTPSGANAGMQTAALPIEKSDDWVQYEVTVNSYSILDGAGRITGLLNVGSADAIKDLYLKDIEVYVKNNENPIVLYDMPSFRPEIGSHPRVYFNKNDIPKIKENALHPENQAAYDLLLKEVAAEETGIMQESTGDNISEKSLGIMQSKAFYYAVWGDEKAGNEAVSAMKKFMETANYGKSEYNTLGLCVFTIGAVYDWCYPLLTASDKTYFQEMGIKYAATMEIGYPPTTGSTVYGHSAEAQLIRDQFVFAVAVSDEREDIYKNIAGRFFEEFQVSKKFLYQAHYLPFGSSYLTYRFQWDMLSSYIMRALGFEDYYGPDQQKVLYWWLYGRRPDGSLLRDGDTTLSNSPVGQYNTTGTRAFWLAGNYWKDPYLKGEVFRRSKDGFKPSALGGNQTVGAVEFILFNDPSVGYKTVRELPLSMYYPAPKGGMIARTSWAEGMNSPAVVAEMEINEWWFQGHSHLDSGSFQIYYKGALANDTGYYQAGRDGAKTKNEGNTVYGTSHFHNYQRRTIAHNCMLVYDPNEPSSNYKGYANDGGQLYHNGEELQLNIQGFFANEDKYHVAKVLGREIGTDTVQPDYTYIKGDLAKAYGEKVPEYERSFMFLNLNNSDTPAAMIVYDRVVSKEASFDKKWVLHGMNKPEISGSRTVFKDEREGYNGKLTVDTLLPKADNLSINTIGGEGQEYLVDGVNYWAQTIKGGANEGGGYRIEVTPKEDNKEDLFLNVLQVADANSTQEPLKSEMIEAGTHVGVKVADRVVMFGKGRDRVASDVSFSTTGEGWFKYTVADLKKGTWKVIKDGNSLCEVVATEDGGIGSFEAGTGAFTLIYLGDYGEKVFTSTPFVTEGINIKVNSKYIYSDVEPTLINSRTMVPLRAIFESLDAKVSWDEATATATGVSADGYTTIKITENSDKGLVNGNEVYLDSPAVIRNGRFLVPVRFISESLGAKVDWDDYSQTVYITKNSFDQDGEFANIAAIKNMTPSGDSGGGDIGDNSIDGDLSTYWSVQGIGNELAWGIYELNNEETITKVALAFKKGNERKYKFTIQASTDGENYTDVLVDAESSGETEELEIYTLKTPIKAKYFKYLGKGSNANAWNNLIEIMFIK